MISIPGHSVDPVKEKARITKERKCLKAGSGHTEIQGVNSHGLEGDWM